MSQETTRGTQLLKEYKQGLKLLWWRLQWQTRPSLSNQERKVISDSIIIFGGGNSEQMVTIVTGLTPISAVHGHLFFGTNLPWPQEVFIEVLALGGKAFQQVNSIRDMTAAQSIRIFYVNSLWHHGTIFYKRLLCVLVFCQFDSLEGKRFFVVISTGNMLHVLFLPSLHTTSG